MNAEESREAADRYNDIMDAAGYKSISDKIKDAAIKGEYHIFSNSIRGNVIIKLKKNGFIVEFNNDPRDSGYTIKWK